MSSEEVISAVRVVPVLSQDDFQDFIVTEIERDGGRGLQFEGEEEIDEDISKSETIILKAITHRGTQTIIHCDPKLPKEDFIDKLVNVRI